MTEEELNIKDNSSENDECSICMNKIEENFIKCVRCYKKNCIICFKKIDNTIEIRNNEVNICYNCPTCRLKINIELINIDNILKYSLMENLKKYIISINNNIIQLEINKSILVNKNEYLLFYTSKIYNIVKLLYIIDKSFILIGFSLYLLFRNN